MKLTLVATCMFGLEKLLGEEIDALGLSRLDTMDGRVTFEGTEADIPRANIALRCAERVFVHLGEFPARSFAELFDGTKSLPWEEWVGRLDAFPVKGHSIKSGLTSLPDCQSIVKKAVVERLREKYGISWFEESGVKYQIEFFIFKDVAHLMIDTSGVALHKRGYRPEAGAAPLRETLAAALVYTARPREDILFWDPFCGSGTIAIEAAMLVSGRAPGLGRSFAGEDFANIPGTLWDNAREEATARIRTDCKFEVYASDIDEDILDITYENALRAGVEEYINIFQADARKIKKEDRKGTVVCNPPYGERMGEREEIERLYQQLGGSFKALYPWQIYVLTSCDRFDRLYGQRADKIKKLYNGMLPCYLYEYFKPAEARDEKGRTAKEIFDRKPDRRPETHPDRGSDRYPADRNRKPDFGNRDRKPYGPRADRPYPPKKKD
ncbi:MAG: class I SAM-dependent RNA methyltransferase [Clostridia bacterium]|nr:class I SAM-dependent RNA methyltransferase [Clostridia bacterium]